jgi:uncharacterized membrane protein AbrB (regulator of aidB expression)
MEPDRLAVIIIIIGIAVVLGICIVSILCAIWSRSLNITNETGILGVENDGIEGPDSRVD